MYESRFNKLIFLLNEKYIKIKSRFLDTFNRETREKTKDTLANMFAIQQKSFPLFDEKLLSKLFVKGYTSLILKIVVKLQEVILSPPNQDKIPDFLYFDIEQLHNEIKSHIVEMNAQSTN
mmetsp:Transcript_30157/g.29459  ORF Transcript_30157/g.29459 Transcript_30157/m.29459 type:complete len:120 (+) Transcript_30157:1218-1577(+)